MKIFRNIFKTMQNLEVTKYQVNLSMNGKHKIVYIENNHSLIIITEVVCSVKN